MDDHLEALALDLTDLDYDLLLMTDEELDRFAYGATVEDPIVAQWIADTEDAAPAPAVTRLAA